MTAGLSGCLGLELVGPTPNLEPQLSISIQIAHDGESSYHVSASFFPGTDETGAPRPTDAALVVNGQTLQGSAIAGGGLIFQWDQISTPRLNGAQFLHLIIPAFDTADQAAPLDIPIAFSTDPLDVSIREGDDVVLHVASQPDAPVFTTSSRFWELRIGGSCSGDGSQATRIQGRDPLPPELRVPWTWIESRASAPIDACLHAFSAHQATGTPYTVHVFSSVSLSWRITVN